MQNPAEKWRLNPELLFTPSWERGKLIYIVENPSTGQFLRIGRREYLIASCFGVDGGTLEEKLPYAAASDPELIGNEAFLRNAIHRLAKLQVISGPQQSAPAAENTTTPSRGWDPLGFRIPLLSGDTVRAICTLFHGIAAVPFVAAYTSIVLIGIWAAMSNWDELLSASSEMFLPSSKFWWLFAWLLCKVVHEFGHAIIAHRIGGAVRSCGVTFFCFAPIPFVDVSDIWRVSSRPQRILCSFAGVLAELLLTAIAVLLFVICEYETVRYGCVAVAAVGSLSAIVFNANPFMKYDGYYVLADLLRRPNLWTEGQQAFTEYVSLLRGKMRRGVGRRLGLACWGGACMAYRTLLMATIAWAAVSIWEGIGWCLVAIGFFNWVIRPQYMKWMLKKTQPPTDRGNVSSLRDIAMLGLWGVLAGVVWFMPSPIARYAPGIIEFENIQTVRSECAGTISEFLAADGQQVRKDQPIVRINNDKLQLELAQETARIASIQDQIQEAIAKSEISNANALKKELRAMEQKCERLSKQTDALILLAPCNGTFVSRLAGRVQGLSIDEHQEIGKIVSADRKVAEMSVSQEDFEAFLDHATGSEIALNLNTGTRFIHAAVKADPIATAQVHAMQLSSLHGGPLPVEFAEIDGEEVLQSLDPRFRIRIPLPHDLAANTASGQLCLTMLDEKESVGTLLQRLADGLLKRYFPKPPQG